MGKNVFANGNEISGRKDDNKSIAAMADVCLSPPSPPAGPVPLPYPNTAKASDTSDGSKSVKLGGDEVGLKNASCYKKSTGDEAATKTLGMGVVTHTIEGKMRHAAWSMDVKVEGKNAIRHMDLTTHNHINCANLAVQLNAAAQVMARTEGLNCDALNFMNQVARAAEIPPGELGGTTTTTAYRVDGMGGRFLKAASLRPEELEAAAASGYAPPVNDRQQPPCAGNRRTDVQHRNDAENKLLFPEMDGQTGGSILMSTMHPAPNPPPPLDAMPCPSCRQSICEAEQCGIQVYLCPATGGAPVRPQAAGLCPPATGTNSGQAWQNAGLGGWPN